MERKRYRPLVDGVYLCVVIPVLAFVALGVAIVAIFDPAGLGIMIPTLLFVLYFIFTPFFGYVELREDTLFIKYGLILKREIPYKRVRAVVKSAGLYSDSMLSLKCAREHLLIKYNSFDVTAVSVVGNDEFVAALSEKCGIL